MAAPLIQLTQNPDGTHTLLSTVPSTALTAINWAAILQSIVAALPVIMAILAAFGGSTPAPSPAPAVHEVH